MRERGTEETKIAKTRERELSEIAASCLTLVLQLRQAHDFGDKDTLRKRIRELLRQFESDAREAGYGSEEIRLGLFALVAFLDETILASEWRQKDDWLANSLQLEYFDRFDAGEEFFAILVKLRQRRGAGSSVLKIYYLSLVLGFKGKYQFLDREKLRDIVDDVYSALSQDKGRGDVVLSPHGPRAEETVGAVARDIPGWLIAVLAVACGFGFYVVMTLLLAGAADTAALALGSLG